MLVMMSSPPKQISEMPLLTLLQRSPLLQIIRQHFRNFKAQKKKKTKLNFGSNNNEHYNKDFIMKELKKALKKYHDTAVRCDDIHYQFLKHLLFRSLDSLLRIFNQVWHTGILPDSWKETIVIPIPKSGKDSTNLANYRPIALTSCICKTME